MEYIYDVVLERGDNCWEAHIPQVGHIAAAGETPEAAIRSITGKLKNELTERLNAGHDIPRYEHTAACVTVGVDVVPDKVDVEKYISLKEAAACLGVSRSRVSQMVTSGRLSSVLVHGSRLIAIESIEEYFQTPRQPGRPRKRRPKVQTQVVEDIR